MRRIIDHFLLQWKHSDIRKSLLIRGARQVGKTYAVRQLGTTFDNFVEINLELRTDLHIIFQKNLDPVRICTELSLALKQPIIPGKTLLFFDEIQAVPRVITALRYFYENMPALHVVAAGSLLDFAIQQEGVPVGRVEFLYMCPVSFIEYLVAIGSGMIVQEIINHKPEQEMSAVVHDVLLENLGHYIAFGGLPEGIHEWVRKKDPLAIARVHATVLGTYRQDFAKYARKSQVKYVELVFKAIPLQLGGKFKYSIIDGEYRKRELAPALDLLVTAGVAHKVSYSDGQGVPLGGQMSLQDYKVILLDVGLAQAALGLDVAQWFLNPVQELVNKGAIAEAFVGQELLAYADPSFENNLYYWHKEGHAEVDYLLQQKSLVVPVEVKAGLGRTLKSLKIFMGSHTKSLRAIRFSAQNYSVYEQVYSYPLYAIAHVMCESNPEMKRAILSLVI